MAPGTVSFSYPNDLAACPTNRLSNRKAILGIYGMSTVCMVNIAKEDEELRLNMF